MTWLGFGYNGTVCQGFSGCDCAPDCDQFYETAHACAQACAAKGGCREDIFVYEGGEKRFDSREMCITSDWLDSVLAIELEGAHLECDTSVIHYCEPGETYCNPIVDDWELVQQYPDYECAVSLIPGVTKLYVDVILK